MPKKNTSLNRALIRFCELSEVWQAEALSNHNTLEQAEDQTYIEPLQSHTPAKHILYDLSEAMRTEGGEYDAVIGVSNNSAIGLKLSSCGESCDLFYI